MPRYMIARFDVTDLTEEERDLLAMEVAVQAEATDGDGFGDDPRSAGKPGVPEPVITYEEDPAIFAGARVRLTRDVERYPHFTAEKGRTGVVTEATHDLYSVKLDEALPGAEEWDNEVHWYPVNGDDPFSDIERLP